MPATAPAWANCAQAGARWHFYFVDRCALREMEMKSNFESLINPVLFTTMLLVLLGLGDVKSHADEAPLSKTTFYVY